MADKDDSRQKLIAILQLAYSGELAAAFAYRGHWHSVDAPDERAAIRKIEEDEWRHRSLVGEMLAGLNSGPNPRRELRATIIGRALQFLCHVTGWLAPMYGAGKLESRNVREYENAARYANDCGASELVDCLLEMAEVEWDHEQYFRSCVLKHRIGRRLPLWPKPPAKETIRLSFEQETISASRDSQMPIVSAPVTRMV
jgi:rubrerythrin